METGRVWGEVRVRKERLDTGADGQSAISSGHDSGDVVLAPVQYNAKDYFFIYTQR